MTMAKETGYPPGKKTRPVRHGHEGRMLVSGKVVCGGRVEAGRRPGACRRVQRGGVGEGRLGRAGELSVRGAAKRDKRSHGTRITTTDLKVPLYPEQTTIPKRRFGERYAEYIRGGQACIAVNSVACEPVSPALERGSIRHFKVKTSAGMLPARTGILRRRSVAGGHGIDLYYRDRLIKAHTRFGIGDRQGVAKARAGYRSTTSRSTFTRRATSQSRASTGRRRTHLGAIPSSGTRSRGRGEARQGRRSTRRPRTTTFWAARPSRRISMPGLGAMRRAGRSTPLRLSTLRRAGAARGSGTAARAAACTPPP